MDKETFILNDNDEYTMSGKVLTYILDQLPEGAKIPFADIKGGLILEGRVIIIDNCCIFVLASTQGRRQWHREAVLTHPRYGLGFIFLFDTLFS